MRKPIESKLILFVFIPLLTLQSCAEMKSIVSPNSPVQTSDHAEQSSQTSSPTTAQLPHTKQAKQVSNPTPTHIENPAKKHMEAGEYQKAINIYSGEYRRHPQDLQLKKEYVKSLDSIKSTADQALENKDFSNAGRLYYLLQNNYAKYNNIVQMLSFDSAYLNAKLSYCKKSLSVQGFQEYRNGHISKALVLWEDVLTIDPNNKDIKEAVKTAKMQQRNLQ